MGFKLKNFTVEAFNRDINRSGDLLWKYRTWSGYRMRLTALIAEAFDVNPQIHIALVLGAGNLNDLDLRFLCARLDKLALSDADTDGIEQGIERQGLSGEERRKIEILQADYTGANGTGLFAELERMANGAVPAAEIAAYIQKAFTELAGADRRVFAETYPLVISSPIYTQLLYTQVEVFLKILYEAGLYAYDDLNLILNVAYGAMPGILARYNATLLNACETDGLIALFSDVVEMPKGSAAFREAKQAEKDGWIGKQTAKSLIRQYGSELAQAGCADFAAKTETARELYAVWPFDETKGYLVYGCLCKRKG